MPFKYTSWNSKLNYFLLLIRRYRRLHQDVSFFVIKASSVARSFFTMRANASGLIPVSSNAIQSDNVFLSSPQSRILLISKAMSKASPEDGFASNGLKDGDEEEDIYEFYFNSVRSIDPPPRYLSSFFLYVCFLGEQL